MASTNKTTHYELSQYVGSDKPTYLTDYNNDMLAIDTGIYNAQSKADSGYTLADTADGKADTAITNAGTAQLDASTALTRIGTMANLDTTEKSSLVGAINEVNGNVPAVLNVNSESTTDTYSANYLNWKYFDTKTGSSSFDLTGITFNELYLVVDLKTSVSDSGVVVAIPILNFELSNSTMSFRCGYYDGASLNGSAYVDATTSSLSLSYAVRNGVNITAYSTIAVYYK